MHKKAIITTSTFKEFLSLFNSDDILENLSLGDTWHPSSGFIDQEILKGKRKVHEIIEFDYNFEGLIGFETNIGDMILQLLTGTKDKSEKLMFEVKGTDKDLKILSDKVIEKNAYSPNAYEINISEDYEQ